MARIQNPMFSYLGWKPVNKILKLEKDNKEIISEKA